MNEPHRYVALLRGINVGGHSVVKMSDLRTQFEAFGLSDVSTYIQSGNVLFATAETDTEALSRRLEAHLESSLGLRPTAFVFSRADLEQASAHNPFDRERLDEEQSCHLMFLSSEPGASRCDALLALQGEEYRFAFWDKVLYYAYPRALAGRRRTINFEKVLAVRGTARTWKVVAELVRLLGDQ